MAFPELASLTAFSGSSQLSKAGAPKGPGRATGDGTARPALLGLPPRGQAHDTAQKGVPGLAGSPPVWKNVP